MVQARKRVSYILPPPSESTPLLQLPPLGVSRLGAIGPLLVTSTAKGGQRAVSDRPQHPRHRLGIASLALDTSTQLLGHQAPGSRRDFVFGRKRWINNVLGPGYPDAKEKAIGQYAQKAGEVGGTDWMG